MADNAPDLLAEQRTNLLRAGVIVLNSDLDDDRPWAVVVGVGAERVKRQVAEELGAAVDVSIAGDLPRRLEPRRCVGHIEREAGRLQLRFVLRGEEHIDEIVVAEDEHCVVVYAIVCASMGETRGDACECPFHIQLDRPLGEREVLDGVTGSPVPPKAVYAELSRGHS